MYIRPLKAILTTFLIPAYLLTYLLRGATVLIELWLLHIFYVRFCDEFLQGGVASSTPNVEDHGISLSLVPPLKPVMGGPASRYAAAVIALEFIGAHKPSSKLPLTR
jgi:hypothetical protein